MHNAARFYLKEKKILTSTSLKTKKKSENKQSFFFQESCQVENFCEKISGRRSYRKLFMIKLIKIENKRR